VLEVSCSQGSMCDVVGGPLGVTKWVGGWGGGGGLVGGGGGGVRTEAVGGGGGEERIDENRQGGGGLSWGGPHAPRIPVHGGEGGAAFQLYPGPLSIPCTGRGRPRGPGRGSSVATSSNHKRPSLHRYHGRSSPPRECRAAPGPLNTEAGPPRRPLISSPGNLTFLRGRGLCQKAGCGQKDGPTGTAQLLARSSNSTTDGGPVARGRPLWRDTHNRFSVTGPDQGRSPQRPITVGPARRTLPSGSWPLDRPYVDPKG